MALLVGNATTTFSVADQTTSEREEFFQFTAAETGTLQKLLFRTNGTANTGVTSLRMGVFSEGASLPSTLLGEAVFTGTPGINSWIETTGLSIAITGGTKYWLAILPIGGTVHYNAAVASGGTGNVESVSGAKFTKLEKAASYEGFNQGPVGFQGEGIKPAATFTAKFEIVAGTAAKLSTPRLFTAKFGSSSGMNAAIAVHKGIPFAASFGATSVMAAALKTPARFSATFTTSSGMSAGLHAPKGLPTFQSIAGGSLTVESVKNTLGQLLLASMSPGVPYETSDQAEVWLLENVFNSLVVRLS